MAEKPRRKKAESLLLLSSEARRMSFGYAEGRLSGRLGRDWRISVFRLQSVGRAAAVERRSANLFVFTTGVKTRRKKADGKMEITEEANILKDLELRARRIG